MRPQSIFSSGLVLVAATTAWPSIFRHPLDTVKRDIIPLIAARQDDSSTSFNLTYQPSSTEDSEPSATRTGDSDASATPTDDSDSTGAKSDSNNSDKPTKTGGSETDSKGSKITTKPTTGGDDSSKTQTGNTTSPTFDARHPAGGVSMITPNPLSPASYYKIHDYITFAWNYTSLSLNPSYVDVLATCTANQPLYTIAANASFDQIQHVTWDTGAYQATGTIPLLTETYTLVIHDAAKDISATAGSGYLGTWKQFTFGMYSPQPYTPIAEYVCATCNGGITNMEKQTLLFIFGTVGVTVASFGWFAGIAGLW